MHCPSRDLTQLLDENQENNIADLLEASGFRNGYDFHFQAGDLVVDSPQVGQAMADAMNDSGQFVRSVYRPSSRRITYMPC